MSADNDFTLGFSRAPDCKVVHFKGSNMLSLSGRAWNMEHGTNYVLEEEADDFSNRAKEAALMVSLKHARSGAILAGGGPTVALNLCRMLLICSKGRVSTICAMHSQSGTSGASGAFKNTGERLKEAVRSLDVLAPGGLFQDFAQITAAELETKLLDKPLALLHVDGESGCKGSTYIMGPGKVNEAKSAGLKTVSDVETHAKECARMISQALSAVPLRKPKFVKVKDVKPEQKGLNVMVKYVKTFVGDSNFPEVPPCKTNKQILCAVCGDETGTVIVSLRKETQTSTLKSAAAGMCIRIQNAHVRMIKGHIYVVIDKWAVFTCAADVPDFKVCEDNDISAVEYELAS